MPSISRHHQQTPFSNTVSATYQITLSLKHSPSRDCRNLLSREHLRFQLWSYAENLLTEKTPRACEFISSVHLHVLKESPSRALKALSHCTHLHNLTLDAFGRIFQSLRCPQRDWAEKWDFSIYCNSNS